MVVSKVAEWKAPTGYRDFTIGDFNGWRSLVLHMKHARVLAMDFEGDNAELAILATEMGVLIAPTSHPVVEELLWTAKVGKRYVFGAHEMNLCKDAIDTQAVLAKFFPLPDGSMLSLCDALNVIEPPKNGGRYKKDKTIHERTNWSKIAVTGVKLTGEQRQYCLMDGYASLVAALYCERNSI
eukprot:3096575-Pleurochrysis_carterae.AAC.1